MYLLLLLLLFISCIHSFRIPPQTHHLYPRAEDTCGNSDFAQLFKNFNGIFFGDFVVGGNETFGSDKALAIQGDLTSNIYRFNRKGTPTCPSNGSISDIGMIVDGDIFFQELTIKGVSYFPHITFDFTETPGTCQIYHENGTGLFSFSDFLATAESAQSTYQSQAPTLHVSGDGTVTRLSTPPPGSPDIVTFATCDDAECLVEGQLSDPSGMLFGQNGYTGPKGDLTEWPDTIVFNVPVTVGSTLTLADNRNTHDINPCGTIFNIYGVDSSGKYTHGSYTINRQTEHSFYGIIVAPEASIIDSNDGHFAGQLIAKNYRWDNLEDGVSLHTFGTCRPEKICIPIVPAPSTSSSEEPSSTEDTSEPSSDASETDTDTTDDSITDDSTTDDSTDDDSTDDDSTTDDHVPNALTETAPDDTTTDTDTTSDEGITTDPTIDPPDLATTVTNSDDSAVVIASLDRGNEPGGAGVVDVDVSLSSLPPSTISVIDVDITLTQGTRTIVVGVDIPVTDLLTSNSQIFQTFEVTIPQITHVFQPPVPVVTATTEVTGAFTTWIPIPPVFTNPPEVLTVGSGVINLPDGGVTTVPVILSRDQQETRIVTQPVTLTEAERPVTVTYDSGTAVVTAPPQVTTITDVEEPLTVTVVGGDVVIVEPGTRTKTESAVITQPGVVITQTIGTNVAVFTLPPHVTTITDVTDPVTVTAVDGEVIVVVASEECVHTHEHVHTELYCNEGEEDEHYHDIVYCPEDEHAHEDEEECEEEEVTTDCEEDTDSQDVTSQTEVTDTSNSETNSSAESSENSSSEENEEEPTETEETQVTDAHLENTIINLDHPDNQ